MSVKVFRDSSLQVQFERDGFLCLPALNRLQIEDLSNLYTRVSPVHKTGIYSNVQDQSPDLNWEINNRIAELFRQFVDRYFSGQLVSGASFLVKHAIDDSECNMHQDYNMVDENQYLSLSIWCPLIDVDLDNGCLQVIQGSHNKFTTIRSLNIPSVYIPFTERLEKHLTALPVKAGTAVVYAHSLFHGSKKNQSNQTRVAAVLGLFPKEASRRHHIKEEGRIKIVKAEEDFFCKTIVEYNTTGKLNDVEEVGSLPISTKTTLAEAEFYETLESR